MNTITKIRRGLITRLLRRMFVCMSRLPVRERLVMFESFLGKQYSCNPRAIYEYMREHHPDFQMVWSVNADAAGLFAEKGIPHVKRFSIRWFYLLARARYWVTNSRMPLWIPKPKHTVYVQTWHGTPLKRLAGDMEEVHMPGTTTEAYKENFYKESRNWDYLLSPNAYSTAIFRRAFWFNRQVVEEGYPRNDVLYRADAAHIRRIKDKYGLPQDKKIILYAPTWRDNQFYQQGKYKFDLELDLQLLQRELGGEYIILLRMHYLVAEHLNLEPFAGFAFDFSQRGDINEMYLAADLLLTDYSSVFFDYANLKRPIIFYTYDLENYRDTLRGFYFDFEKQAPGPLVETTPQVLGAIRYYEEHGLGRFQEKYNVFYNRYCRLEDGAATKRAVEQIFFRKAQDDESNDYGASGADRQSVPDQTAVLIRAENQ